MADAQRTNLKERNNRSKYWCYTDFDLKDGKLFDSRLVEYCIEGRETCPDTSRVHLQGFVVFKNRQRFGSVKAMLPTAHIERARGTPQEAAEYCRKDGNYREVGRLPEVSCGGDRFRAILVSAENGAIESVKRDYPALYIRYKTTLHSLAKYDVTELDNSCGVWICGPPRCGKDASVRKLGDVYNKPLSKWWDGYEGQKLVLISDIEPQHGKWLGYFLKIWCDRYAFNAEVKGSFMKIRPKKIFCTSNFRLDECFDGNVLQALQARMSVYDEFDKTVTKRPVVSVVYSVYDKLLANEDGLLAPAKENVDPLQGTSKATVQSVPDEEEYSSAEEFTTKKTKKSNK
uniref:Replication-associated protein n=1 Tax=Phylloscopus fuscatus CRESS-DNA-virus sp. TaxID=2815054 RepID=A0A8A4XD65_9VIRU|nr:MAG: replication-associated protein [Phylloscopus fuscatus CRESS-DNA-virus sp.]